MQLVEKLGQVAEIAESVIIVDSDELLQEVEFMEVALTVEQIRRAVHDIV